MASVTYSVPNISCGHCVHTIQTKIAQVVGVKSVKADAVSKRVEIVFDAPASEDGVRAQLAEIRFPIAP